MKISQVELIAELELAVKSMISRAKELDKLNDATLVFRPGPEKWNVLEIIEHLNLYSDFYLNAIEKSASTGTKIDSSNTFKPGLLGNYFAKSMLPKSNGEITNSMKTFKDKNTLSLAIDRSSIEKFMNQQEQLLGLLEKCKNIELNKAKTGITISKLLKLKLGDTLRFYINHEVRHFVQIENNLKALNGQV